MNCSAKERVPTQLLWGVASAMTLTAILLGVFPAAAGWADLERPELGWRSAWTMLTCQLTHWNGQHLLWDLGSFAILMIAGIQMRVRRMPLLLMVSSLSIPLAVVMFQPRVEIYRGLSGVDTALFTLIMLHLMKKSLADGDRVTLSLFGLALLGLLGKTGYECIADKAVFVRYLGEHVIPVPVAHLSGIVIGLVVGAKDLRPLAWKWRTSLVSN